MLVKAVVIVRGLIWESNIATKITVMMIDASFVTTFFI
jgi:hypothetical protein